MAAPKAHKWIMGMTPYVPGKSTLEGIANPVKLSSNESVFGASPLAVEAFRNTAENLMRYPDANSNELRDTIADLHSLKADNIICGAGSDELLTLLIHVYAGEGDEVIFSKYGFMVYAVQSRAVGAVGVPVPNKNWAADVDGMLAAVTDKTKLVIVDNPNNPTGAYNTWDEIKRLHAGLRDDIVLVLDAAYAECVTAVDYNAGSSMVEENDNVIMTRTFSKMYALAGLRVGWAYGAPGIIDVMNRVRMPFNVCVPGHPAAIEAAKDEAHLQASVDFNTQWRDWLTLKLRSLGLDTVESQTNFVLVEFPSGNKCAEACNAFLMSKGYLVRALPPLPNHLRISIGTAEQNEGVFALISEFLGK